MKSTLQLKRLTAMINRGASPVYTDEGKIKFINQASIYWSGLKDSAIKSADERKHTPGSRGYLHRGDILVNSTGTGTLGRATVFDIENDGTWFADSHVTIVRPDSTSLASRYLYYAIRSDRFQDEIYTTCVSGSTNQIELSREKFREIHLLNLEMAKQEKITKYLDEKTSAIDKMIAAKNHTQTQLSELRTTIISNAVRSGVEATNAPKVRLKSIVSVYNGATPKSDNPEFWDGDVAWATPVDLSKSGGKFLESTQRNITRKGYLSCNTKLIDPGNIVISNRAPIGLVAINKIPVCTNQGCKVLVLKKEKINATYLYYYLSAITDDLQNLGTGTTFMEISSDTLKNIKLSLPVLKKQQEIAEMLDEKISKLDTANMRLSDSIELLEEYRASLISNVITGKVEV